MDFFLDSDDDHSVNDDDKSSNNQKKNKNGDGKHNFQCENCGGADSYMDSNTGGLCCTQCFTQSQTTIAASQVDMDMDETLGLMARTRQGAAIGRYQKKNGNGLAKKQQRKPLKDYDSSKTLPNVQDCIRGIQRVLKECSPIISDLAGADDNEAVLTSCKTIWNAYLQSWHDGAQQYGTIYPEIRFSFRDCFLEGIMRQKVIRTLSYKALDHVKQLLGEEKDQAKEIEAVTATITASTALPTLPQKRKQKRKANAIPRDPIEKRRYDIEQILANASGSDNDEDMDDDDDDDNNNRSSRTKSKPNVVKLLQDDDDDDDDEEDFDDDEDTEQDCLASSRRLRSMHGNRIECMLHLHNLDRPCGRREAALALKPSMTVVAAILWMAVSPLGITGGHICDWVSNGSLPLINAFSLLSSTERTNLRSVESFFGLKDRTNVKALTKAIVSLQVICDYQPPSIIRRSDETNKLKMQKRGAFINTVKQQAGVRLKSGDHAAAKIRSIYNQQERIKAFVPGQLLTPTSVPLLAARFVADLKLSQTILNLTFALMGVPTARKTHKKVKGMPTHWIPPKLKRARPEKLQDPAHVLAVIVIACKLTPEWYTQDYHRPLSSDYSSTTTTTTNNNNQTQSAFIKLEDNDDNDHALLFVDQQETKRHAKRQKTMQARSRFVPWSEEQFRCLGNGPIMEGYLDFLEEQLVSDSSEAVLPDFIAALEQQLPTTQEDSQQQQQQVRPCPTLWAPFRRPQKIARKDHKTCQVFKTPNGETGPPPSVNFGTLVEYMAYRTCVEPSKIESFALELDDEIQKRFCIQNNVELHPIALYRWIGDPRSAQVHEPASVQATAMTELNRERLVKPKSNRSLVDRSANLVMASETTTKRKPQSINAGAKKVQEPLARSAAKRKSPPNETAEDTEQTQVNAENTELSSVIELQSQSLSHDVVQAFIERGEVEWI